MNRLLTIMTAVAGLAFSSANAATIDFSDQAANNEHGVENGAYEAVNGLNIRYFAFAANEPGNVFNAYFDDVNGAGLPAGLGVCRALDSAGECANSGDDSIDGEDGLNEILQLLFYNDAGDALRPVDINGLSFRDGNHNLINNSDGLLSYAIIFAGQFSATPVIGTFADLTALAAAGFEDVVSISFSFVDTAFYVESLSIDASTPLPGAVPLLLSGLAGLGFATRRRRKKLT